MSIATTINPVADRAGWLKERRKGIGASECAQVLCRSEYGDPTSVALRKLGRLPEAEESEAMEIGTLSEPILVELYQRRHGRRIVEQQVFRRHDVHSWMFATADAFDDAGDLVELKTTDKFSDAAKALGEDGSADVCDQWMLQAQHQMAVFNKPRVNFAVLVGGNQYRYFVVLRRPLLIDAIVLKLGDFWKQVERGEVPEGPFTRYDPRLLAALNPECEGEIEASEQLEKDIACHENLGKYLKVIEDQRDELKNKILQALGTNQFAALSDGRKVKRYLLAQKERVNTVKAHVKHYFQIVKIVKGD